MACPETVNSFGAVLAAQCNLRCDYCYQNAKRPMRMDWETLRTVLDLVLSSPHEKIDLSFQGGEPLIEFPAIRRAIEYVERNSPPRKRIHYNISTNGTLLTGETAAFLARHSFDTRISLDGIADAQSHRGEDTFPILDRLLDRLRREHPDFYHRNLTINCIVIPPTIPLLAESFDYFLEKGIEKILISPTFTHYPGWSDDCIAELDAQFARIYERSLEHLDRTGKTPLLLLRHHRDDAPGGHGTVPMCGIINGQNLTVDVDGQMYGCSILANSFQERGSPFLHTRLSTLEMGNIIEPGLPGRHASFLEAVRREEIFNHKEKKYSSYGRCAACPYIHECSLCPISIGHIPGNSDPRRVPDFYCAFNMVSLKYRSRFPARPGVKDLAWGLDGLSDEMRRLKKFAEAVKKSRPAIRP